MWQCVKGRLRLWVSVSCIFLAACQGTVKHAGDPTQRGKTKLAGGIGSVQLTVSESAQSEARENRAFDQKALETRIHNALRQEGLIVSSSKNTLGVELTDLRLRSTFSAVMFGFMAGDDHLTGTIRVMNEWGREVQQFEVNSSYALGGFGGGQDQNRLDWLYTNFSDLTATEVGKLVTSAQGKVPLAVAVTQPAEAVAPTLSPEKATQPQPDPRATPPSGGTPQVVTNQSVVVFQPIVLPEPVSATPTDHVLAQPELAERYRQYLSRPQPKAFAVADNGGWWMAWGSQRGSRETPSERALRGCEERSKSTCVLYAVDDRVVHGRGLGGVR
jgi:hypothetical protein